MRKIVGSLFVLMLAVSLVLIPAPVSADPGLGDSCTCDAVKWWENKDSRLLYLQHWGKTPLSAMSRLAGLAYPDMLHQDVCDVSDQCKSTKVTGCDVLQCEGGCCSCNEQEGCTACCDDPTSCEPSNCGETCECVECCSETTAALAPVSGDTCIDTQSCYLCSDDCISAGCGVACTDECVDGSAPFAGKAKCCCCWGKSLCFANKSWAGCDIDSHPRWNNCHPNHFGNSFSCGTCEGVMNWGGDWGTSGCPHTECFAACWCLQDNICEDFGAGCESCTSSTECPCQHGVIRGPCDTVLDWCPSFYDKTL